MALAHRQGILVPAQDLFSLVMELGLGALSMCRDRGKTARKTVFILFSTLVFGFGTKNFRLIHAFK